MTSKLSFQEAIYHLKKQEIVYCVKQGKMTFFALVNESIRVYNENCNYYMNPDDFETLFSKETFFLYEKVVEEDGISKEKDDEYYSWWHK